MTADNSPANDPANESSEKAAGRSFIQQIIDADIEAGKNDGRVQTRFPPEPNGYLHIGHAKSICLNYGIAKEYAGTQGPLFNLRFDDTNPAKEDQEYVDAIKDDVRWLGAEWDDRLFHASDYFDQLYAWAMQLIKEGKAYVCDLDAEQMREHRGTLTEPGTPSPYRDRTADENIDLLERMKAGEFADGEKTLRAKIDMASPNVNLRDPVMYRIKKATHQATGDTWCIYPSYDYTHGQSDSIEGITHSICTLEFENHRPLYDWFCEQLGIHHPQQIEFARLNLTYAVMSKRKLLQLVEEKHVAGWDDPRMPTIRGLRRRGYTSDSIQNFCKRIGVAKQDSLIDMLWLEDSIREHLNEIAHRRMAVLNPLKVELFDVPAEGPVKVCHLANHPQQPEEGEREITLGKTIYVEQDDFMEEAPKKFFRLKPGGSVRLRGAGIATCEEVVKNDAGEVTLLRCSFNPDTAAKIDGKKVKGTIHWVDAETAIDVPVRLYDHLFQVETPEKTAEGETFLDHLNPNSLQTITSKAEPVLADAAPGTSFQFERVGYFYVDPVDSQPGKPVLNRTVTLRDTWGKEQKK